MSSHPATLHLHRDELKALLAVVGRYRLRLGAEMLLRFIVRGLIVGALLIIPLSATDWLLELDLQPVWLWAALALPAVAALGLALALWPSERQAARVADHRLQLEERVGTAVELGRARHKPGLFDQLQLQDAVATVTSTPHRWPSFLGSLRSELLIALGVGVLAIMSLMLPSLPRPRFEPAAEVPAEVVTATDDRLVPTDILDIPGLDAMTIDAQTVEADLAPRVRQAQAEQEALDRLAQALGQISAGQSAADAINRGDFGDARSQISALGEEADQLSDAAKKQLAQALQQAAAASGADRQLADRERQAAVSLSRNTYAEQRNAMRQLGEQVERSGARSVPAAQLARDAGRLQQQQQSNGGEQGAAGQTPGASSIQAQPGAGMMSGAQGGQSATGADAGEQGGVGAGTGTTEGVGDPASRLATQGQVVEVPTKLGAGAGQRPTDGTEDQVGTNPGVASRTVAEAAQTQQTGQVTPEQNLVPGDQRPVVRGYFR